jgi:hypothetical protein
MKRAVFRQVFEKQPNMKFHKKNPVVVHVDGRKIRQTDNHYEINSRFFKFCERTL